MSVVLKPLCNNVTKFGTLVFSKFSFSSYFPVTHKFPALIATPKTLIVRSYCEEKVFENEQEPGKIIDAAKDRSKVIPVEVSKQYLKSSAYKTTYGEDPVWTHYRRNHKGQIPPRKTRKRCIRQNVITTGNPCPICRDEYLVLHPENTELLKQFISPHTGEILSYTVTGLCQRRHQELIVAIMQAKDLGLIAFDLPFREYDYSEYVDLIGGGIAGVSCAEALSFLCPEKKIALITASPLIKAVTNLVPLTKMLASFDVEEREADTLSKTISSLSVIHNYVIGINSIDNLVYLKDEELLKYKKLCLCSGGSPKLIPCENKNIIGIRDTESVKEFQNRVINSRRIIVVGNGGIATEIIYELSSVELIWVIKDDHISATFIDPVAAEFFQDKLLKKETSETTKVVKRLKYTVEDKPALDEIGAALGPDWHAKYNLYGSLRDDTKVIVEYKSEVDSVLRPEQVRDLVGEDDLKKWPVFVKLTKGKIYGCDFIVSATGVTPCSNFELRCGKKFDKTDDGGIKVDWKMETNLPNVYAAGDVCSASWDRAQHWFQMRLWTQARQMGTYAAKAMVSALKGEQFYQDFCFEMFSHVTKFFGYKVVLLGLFNGQTLENNYEVLLRITKGVEYVKLVMKNGRMQGAVLIGETDLEEMCENLILNQLDLTDFGEDLLNPDIDIEDYFD